VFAQKPCSLRITFSMKRLTEQRDAAIFIAQNTICLDKSKEEQLNAGRRIKNRQLLTRE